MPMDTRPRVDVRPKITGAAVYTADVSPPKMVHARFLRCPFAGGRVVAADADRIRAVPGVLDVALEVGARAQHVGDRVGHVVAETEAALAQAMQVARETIMWKAIEPRTMPEALLSGPPAASAATRKLMAEAAVVVRARLTTQNQTHSCFETHGGVVDYRADGPDGPRAEAWGSTQSTFGFQEGLTGPLGLDADAVHLRCEYVGGGFGSKFGAGAEGALAARVSRRLGRPCRVMLTRAEEHVDAGHRPGSVQDWILAADAEGTILGGQVRAVGVVGHSKGGGGVRLPLLYDFGELRVTKDEVTLTTDRPRAFRAPGYPQAVFALETMLDAVADRVGVDPLELRRRHETSPRRVRQMARCAELAGWARRKPAGTAAGPLKRGFGYGGTLWKTWPTNASATVEVLRSGKVRVLSGVQDIGTGTRTVLVAVAAHALGLPRDQVAAELGSSRLPHGPGSGGSVTARTIAPAVEDASAKALAELSAHVARAAGVPERDVGYSGGVFRLPGGDRLAWADACASLPDAKLTASGKSRGEPTDDGSSDGCQIAEVLVDTETGVVTVARVTAVQACGRVVNATLADNQIAGGIVQGLSYALFEDRALDPTTGALLHGGLEGYKIAGPQDVPPLTIELDEQPEDVEVRPLGEPPTVPTAAAIACAVSNAIGARITALPITPRRVLEALDRAARGDTDVDGLPTGPEASP